MRREFPGSFSLLPLRGFALTWNWKVTTRVLVSPNFTIN
jgi:hypothetical protein